VVLTVLGEVVEHRSLGDVGHDVDHLVDRPRIRAKVEAASVELAALLVVEVCLVQLTEHRHRGHAIKDRGIGLEVAAVPEANEREDGLAHERGPETDEVLPESFDGVSLCLLGKPLLSPEVIRPLVLDLRDEHRIHELVPGLPSDVENPPVWPDGAAIEVIVEGRVRIAVPELSDDVFQVPLLLMRQRNLARELPVEALLDLAQRLDDVRLLLLRGDVDHCARTLPS